MSWLNKCHTRCGLRVKKEKGEHGHPLDSCAVMLGSESGSDEIRNQPCNSRYGLVSQSEVSEKKCRGVLMRELLYQNIYEGPNNIQMVGEWALSENEGSFQTYSMPI